MRGDAPSPDTEWWRRPVRFVLTVLVFALLGPLIGGAITIVGYVIFGFHITLPGEAGWAILAALIYGLWLAYPIGLVPAAGLGAIIAVRDRFGGSSLAEAALIGGGIGCSGRCSFPERTMEISSRCSSSSPAC